MERTVKTQRSSSRNDEFSEEVGLKITENSIKSSSPDAYNGRSYSNDSSPPANINNSNNNNTLHRSRSQNKVKLLVRSHAVREETSPPPDPFVGESEETYNSNAVPSPREHHSPQPTQNHLSNQPQQQQIQQSTSLSKRHKLRREGSSQENWDHPPLSRGNSREQYDGANQIDLHQFIVETLNRNYKDRMLLLKIESDLISLAKDPKRTVHKFAQMSSYQRMLVHRVAAYFGMDHNVDTSGASVIVNTTKTTRIPDMRFREAVRDDLLLPEEPRRSILKRDSSSFDETGSFKSVDRMLGGDSRRSKSFEEREEEYEKVRRRIFNREHSHCEGDDCMDELHWDHDEGLYSQCENPSIRTPRLIKVESYESTDALRANSLRLSVSKSHSFNGYEPPVQTRILTKQDSGSSMSSRISPSSSGYKSQRSDATLSATPSPSATPHLHTQLSGQSGGALSPEPETVVWAVTDLASVPPGSMLIHPQSGQPYTNSDGSIYHYDPSNPPRVAVAESQPSPTAQTMQPQKHNMLDPGAIVNATMGPQSSLVHGHEFGKQGNVVTIIDNGGYDNGNPGYVAQPNMNPGGQLPIPHQYQHPQVVPNGDGSVQTTHYSTPVVYPMHATPVPPMSYPIQYDARIQDNNMAANNDLSNYMMGLSIDGNNPPQPRQIMYWPSHQIQPHTGVPVYYNNGPNGVGPTRFPMQQIPSAACPPSSQAAFVQGPQPPPLLPPPPHQSAQPSAMVPGVPGPAPPPAHISPEQPGCYGSTFNNGQECVTYPSPAVHMYYTHPYSSGAHSGVSNGGPVPANGNSFYGNGVSNCSAPILAVQYQQQCPHPASPRTPQGACNQFAVYNGCYPGHYAQSNSTLPVPPLFRKAMPVGARCASPIRPSYPISPSTVNDRGPDDKIPPLPVYGFRVLPGEMRLLGNQGRIPFAISASKGPNSRKNRTKISNQGRPQHSIDVPALNSTSKV